LEDSRVEVMRPGQYVVLAAALPGRASEAIGVGLHDPAEGRLEFRFRRDWDEIADPEDAAVLELLAGDLDARTREMGAEGILRWMEDTLSNAILVSDRQPVMMGGFESTLRMLYGRNVQPRVLPFRTHLPVYTCRAAAGRWGEQAEVEPAGWTEAPGGLRLTKDMFVAQVVGRSMEPVIPDGAECVFRANVVGSRQGKRVLVENLDESEAGGQRYTVKRYVSEKRAEEDGWRHVRIRLEPLNPEFEAWELEEGQECRVIAELVCVL